MAKKAQKIAVIGLDCALPGMMQKYIDEGVMPNTKKLVENGFFAEDCLCPLPTITPPNWATIATGAWPGTHGITCFHYPLEGKNPDNSNIRQAWSSERWQCESIWDAASKQGKKSIVLTFPGAWPSKSENAVVVGGDGFIPGDHRNGMEGLETQFEVLQDFIVTNEFIPYSTRSKWEDVENWENIPSTIDINNTMEMSFDVSDWGARQPIKKTTWYILTSKNSKDDFESITLCTKKDYNTALFTLKKGDWSERIVQTLQTDDGVEHKVFFRCKLLAMDNDGEGLRLFVGAMIPMEDTWISQKGFAESILSGKACLHRSMGLYMYAAGGVIDFETFLEIGEEMSRFLAEAATGLMKAIPDWSIFYMHSHPIDWFYHAAITDMVSKDPKIAERAWEGHKRIYASEDKLIGAIIEAAGKDTIFAIVSDHGAVPDGPVFNPYEALVPAGLSVFAEENLHEETSSGNDGLVDEFRKRVLGHVTTKLNYSKTIAVPQRETYIYINLKGREPEGIVDPADYKKVQQEIIDALLGYRDPNMNNMRPVALALTKEDARILGLYGDRIGDVVYAINPEWGAQHGAILPTAKWSCGELHSVLIISGHGLKKGYRMAKPCNLVDLVPTLCYLTGLPYPDGCEGAVLYPALSDPNFKDKEIAKLNKSLESMEAAMERGQRQPWDKHDCA